MFPLYFEILEHLAKEYRDFLFSESSSDAHARTMAERKVDKRMDFLI